ncbi:MFS transporter [Microaerobacter geothermalis]|uniref:MFS transporter n=1 Tax=Microaerobacter geothermalis TaxID=674972 RepID=UPI001F3236B4|nr:MFS transporter [Microaerobacter geothermalis]MCF6094162.1 MFS transporter [Microaerobacter geothermalis]
MEDSQKSSSKVTTILTLSSIPLIMVLGNSMIIPILPTVKSTLDLTQFQVSLLITLFSIPAGIIIPLSGILSDRIGRKKIIAFSLLLYGAGGIVAGTAVLLTKSPFYWILAGRVLQGIGAAGTAPIAMALVSDIFTSQERSKILGIIEASNGLGKVLSPILGSLIALITWYALFFAFPILCIPAAIAVWFFIREPNKNKKPIPLKQYKDSIIKVWKNKGKWLSIAFLSGAVTLFVLFGVLFYLSDILEATYKINGVKKGLVLAIPLLGMSLTSYWTGSFIQKRRGFMRILIVIGLISVGVVSSLVPFISNNILLISLLTIGGIGSGFVLPCLNTMITSAVPSQERGMITSLYGSVRFIGVAVGPPVFGALMDKKQILFWSISGIAFLTAILVLLFLKQTSQMNGEGRKTKSLFRKRQLAGS